MRLKTIEIAGFKSFLAPTKIVLRSHFTAIVGPNGCGKSNIVEALSWAIGENAAKYLRTNDMSSVIFNGTAKREPLGQASIELVFDNSDAKLGGKYAGFSEISVKRTVCREGQSTYYLNRTACRRKDILEAFAGTGLGPRRYALIAQGTVSELVEANPEQLGHYFKEIAGITRYEESRRETLRHIAKTQDNLTRFSDLLHSIEDQLEHLTVQAKKAEQFQRLKRKIDRLQAERHALQYKSLKTALEDCKSRLSDTTKQFHEHQQVQQQNRKALEAVKVTLQQHQAKFNQLQDKKHQLAHERVRLDQTIQNRQARAKERLTYLKKIESSLQQVTHHQSEDKVKLDALQKNLETLKPDIEIAQAALDEITQDLKSAENVYQEIQQTVESRALERAKNTQTMEIEKNKILHLTHRLEEHKQDLTRLKEELEGVSSALLEEEAQNLAAELQQQMRYFDEAQNKRQSLQADIKQKQGHLSKLKEDFAKDREHLKHLQGVYTALQSVQAAGLGHHTQAFKQWLDTLEIAHKPQLAQQIDVDTGWEWAVEVVLGNFLEAICISREDRVIPLAALPTTTAQLYLTDTEAPVLASEIPLPLLASKINTSLPIHTLLSEVYASDSLTQAFEYQPALGSQASIITPEGLWLGKYWVRAIQPNQKSDGVMLRKKKLARLADDIACCQSALQEKTTKIAEQKHQLEQKTQHYEQLKSEDNQQSQKIHSLKTRLENVRAKSDDFKTRSRKLTETHRDKQLSIKQLEEALVQAQTHLKEQSDYDTLQNTETEQLISQRETAQSRLNHHQTITDERQTELFHLTQTLNNTQSQITLLQTSVERFDQQLVTLRAQLKAAQSEHESCDPSVEDLTQTLKVVDQQYQTVEQAVLAEQNFIKASTEQVETHQKTEQSVQEAMNDVRQAMETIKLDVCELEIKCQHHKEQMAEAGYEDWEALCEGLPSEADHTVWAEHLAKAQARLERFGPINLAAIQESEQLSEKKWHLTRQKEDLEVSLAHLQSAMQTIDKKIRVCFNQAYTQVNAHFQNLFPRLFRGGQANLRLIGEEILNAGVVIEVQPPGKVITTLQALSGGEKALTALALVLAFFKLNPAPFCVLDEVDAPLDDVNLREFYSLVQDMAQTVQFIIVTHNRMPMEMAEQLIGVTMHEPGVSRLVSVDIEAAMRMAAA